MELDVPGRAAFLSRAYREALSLADQALDYFSANGDRDRRRLPPRMQAVYTAESLRISSRLMHVIAWVLVQRAVEEGEISPEEACEPDRRLGGQDVCLPRRKGAVDALPDAVREMLTTSQRLYCQAQRLETLMLAGEDVVGTSPVHNLLNRLDASPLIH